MDEHNQFKRIVYGWLRPVGLLLGHEVTRSDYRPTLHTVLITLFVLTIPSLYALTAYYSEGELGMKGGACIGMGLKASATKSSKQNIFHFLIYSLLSHRLR